MTNNKAREINSPLIEELINETSPEELAKIDTEMTNNKLGNTIGVTWDEYGNPIPVINDEQSIIDYNAMEEEWEMDNYNEMNNE
jgi:hypothetical protein